MRTAADAIRDQSTLLRTADTISQLASIKASTLRAPRGLHDERADSFALALAALADPLIHAEPSNAVPDIDPLRNVDRYKW